MEGLDRVNILDREDVKGFLSDLENSAHELRLLRSQNEFLIGQIATMHERHTNDVETLIKEIKSVLGVPVVELVGLDAPPAWYDVPVECDADDVEAVAVDPAKIEPSDEEPGTETYTAALYREEM